MKLTNAELDALLAVAGLQLSQPYYPTQTYHKTDWLFTTCTICGTQAHYRLKYVIDKNRIGEPVCRACFWKRWYEHCRESEVRSHQSMLESGYTWEDLVEMGVVSARRDLTMAEAEDLASSSGYDLIELQHGRYPGSDVMVVRCRACGRQVAERADEVGSGCSCGGPKAHGGVRFGSESQRVSRVPIPTGDEYYSDGSPRRLRETHLECLVWWDHERNSEDLFDHIMGKSNLGAWWKCPKCGHSFRAPVHQMAMGPSCPRCRSFLIQEIHREQRSLEGLTVADVPELLRAWADERDPSSVLVKDIHPHHFECPNGHHPMQTPSSYLKDGCMVCRAQATRNGKHVPLRESNPELSSEWLSALDGDDFTPDTVWSGSKRKVTWRCIACGGTWVATVSDREKRKNNRCPHCGKVMGSLAWKYPQLAAEWSPDNPRSPWNVKPYGQLDFVPEWVCLNDISHRWRATTADRIRKRGECPWCHGDGNE